MANIKSAKKRIKVINRQKAENKLVKATISTYTKKFRALVAEGKLVEAEAKLKETISLIDSAESKGVLHKNNASRKVARLTAALDKARGTEVKAEAPKKVEVKEVEKVEEEKPAKKATTKKATTKKAETTEEKPAKKATKSTAKKETEEKPAKKTTAKKAAAKKAE